jgi:hypothetical protein
MLPPLALATTIATITIHVDLDPIGPMAGDRLRFVSGMAIRYDDSDNDS